MSAVRLDHDDGKVPDTTFHRPPNTFHRSQGCPSNRSFKARSEDQLDGSVPRRALLPKFLHSTMLSVISRNDLALEIHTRIYSVKVYTYIVFSARSEDQLGGSVALNELV